MKITPESLTDILADITCLDANDITNDMTLTELDLDSLDVAEFLAAAEHQFAVELDEADFLNCNTVGDILKMIQDAQDFSEPLGPASACTDEGCESCQ